MPAVGDSFLLFTDGSMSGGFAALDLPALPDGEQWDTSAISSGGLTVVPEPGSLSVLAGLASLRLLRRRRLNRKLQIVTRKSYHPQCPPTGGSCWLCSC